MTEEQIFKELKRINESVPAYLKSNVVTEQFASPTVKKVVDTALEDPNFPEEKKQQLILLKENGYFDKTKPVENPKIVKQIDQYVMREIRKSIKEGRLPNRKELKELNLFKLHEK